jgi:ABC-2 type transport system permease protein
MRKVWLIIKREYITRVKTKGFVIGTLIVPLIGIGFTLLIVFLVRHQSSQSLRLDIVDNSGGLAQSITGSLDGKLPDGRPQFAILATFDRPESPDSVQNDLRAKINSGSLDAYLLIPKDLDQPVQLHTKNPGNISLLGQITGAVNPAVVEARLNARGIHVDDVRAIVRGPAFQVIKVTKDGEAVEKGQTFGIAIALVILLYTSLMMYGIITMRSVLEEKTTRTMEVLISTVDPSELLAGKILGVAAVAFTQFTIWACSLALLSAFGISMAAVSGAGTLFSGIHVPTTVLFFSVVYFLGGYFLYASIFAAVGAACSNEQDAGQLQWFGMAPLVFTMVVYWTVISDPTSRASMVLTEIPFFSPVLMPLRISLQMPPIWQIALSIALLLVSIVVVIYGSAKIYRVGVLMYGKRPTLPEMVRWMRYS